MFHAGRQLPTCPGSGGFMLVVNSGNECHQMRHKDTQQCCPPAESSERVERDFSFFSDEILGSQIRETFAFRSPFHPLGLPNSVLEEFVCLASIPFHCFCNWSQYNRVCGLVLVAVAANCVEYCYI